MTFEEEFPNLVVFRSAIFQVPIVPTDSIQKHCLDKKRVREVLLTHYPFHDSLCDTCDPEDECGWECRLHKVFRELGL